jgi:hypothetical protein
MWIVIDMSQDSDQWKALVNTVMNLRVSYNPWKVLEWLLNLRFLKKSSAPSVNKETIFVHGLM